MKDKSEENLINTFALTFLHLCISLHEHLSPLLRLRAHRLRQVAKSCRICEIERLPWKETSQTQSGTANIKGRKTRVCVWPHFRLVVSEDPGEDWILHQIIVGSPGDCVQVHQILKVTYFPFLEDDKMKRHGEKQKQFLCWMSSTLINSFTTSVSNECRVFTCHFRITAFSTTEVFLKHRREKEHMSEADH